ncbi:integron integrase [Verrucomicrobiota bacterium]|nr:integron integrase [Verrucomicrobiota bacterium]
MNVRQAVEKLSDVVRRKHLSLSTEQSYCGWLKRYCTFIQGLPSPLPSEQKLERFLTELAREGVAASTQNQAFNAIIFFYKEVAGQELKNIQGLRARRPEQVRSAPSREDTARLLKAVQAGEKPDVSLAVRLLYGCGLRVTEPLNLRVKDVQLEGMQLVIRAAKGGKDRVVPIPGAVVGDLRGQLETARAVWTRDQHNEIPVALPHLLAAKYPQAQFDWNWAWVFPARDCRLDPRSKQRVRWRLHEVNVQRAVRNACRKIKVSMVPHELRHAYATHCLNRGANPRAIQEVMGHKSLETTMAYLHGEALGVRSPLDDRPGSQP